MTRPGTRRVDDGAARDSAVVEYHTGDSVAFPFELPHDRVRQKVNAKQFQIFDCYVLKEWSVDDMKKKLGFSSGQIYMAKYRVGKLFKHELEQLLEEEN